MVTTVPPTMTQVFGRPPTLTAAATPYCPGCGHGIVLRLLAEVLDALGIRRQTIGVASVGCSVSLDACLEVDFVGAAHGRAPATATGIKRVQPDRAVFTYQGDGDLVSIGLSEILHAAARGEKLTVVYVNNCLYGMTGGQMSPTTLPGMATASSPGGRDVAQSGWPLRVIELFGPFPGVAYAVRRSIHDARHIRQTRKALLTAFQAQLQGLGLGIVEILSPCPTNWKLAPTEAMAFLRDQIVPAYPLGDFKVNAALAAAPGETAHDSR